MIRRAIEERACLSGTHVAFRVRFAPHALGRDENGRQSVLAFEYGGLTLGRPHWVCFVVDRLRGLQRTGDPWRSGSPESRPQFDLTEIEAAVDTWSLARLNENERGQPVAGRAVRASIEVNPLSAHLQEMTPNRLPHDKVRRTG